MDKKKRTTTNLPPMQWCNVELHIHTPASSDFQQLEVSYADILKRAEVRGLNILAITDHNTVAGYRRIREEIQQLELLESLKRLLPDEQTRLADYRRILDKILILPGFEFTATFGFHILAIFPPEKPLRELEYLLLELKIPTDKLDEGSATVGATTDVLAAYRMIDAAGGLVIAAHANSSNGVAMRGFPLGGQTKIAYTQDQHLHALEVTDLDSKGQHATARFFNGTKPEYPRRMHCIQGSDSHRLTPDPVRKKNLGLGERTIDLLLPEVSFEAIRGLFMSNDFARTRPHRVMAEPAYDFLRAAQEEGPNIIQDFHETITVRGGKQYAIISDVCAFANTNGGTLYLGISSDAKVPPVGIVEASKAVDQLGKELNNRISPELSLTIDIHQNNGKNIIRVLIPRGDDPPYAVDDNKIYVRSEADTVLAVRDEIVGLVLRSKHSQAQRFVPKAIEPVEAVESVVSEKMTGEPVISLAASAESVVSPQELAPRTGVEIAAVEERSGERYYAMRDLRNGEVVKNVTLKSSRRLWHYAITTFLKMPSDLAQVAVQWQGDLGILTQYKQGKNTRYDLVQRTGDGYRYYFGVTEDGIHGPWKLLVGEDDEGSS